jgi:hypothetical protein
MIDWSGDGSWKTTGCSRSCPVKRSAFSCAAFELSKHSAFVVLEQEAPSGMLIRQA